jgi:hypothetical protein
MNGPSPPLELAIITNVQGIRDLGPDALAAPGRPRIMPASFYRDTTVAERALFGQRNGIYGFPTAEQVDWLRAEIGGRSAIEIGAGHGALADALGIPATDSKMQLDPLIAQFYAASGQPTVIYGPDVEQLDAAGALARYRPQVVIATWVTHKFDEARSAAGGNMFGVDEEALLDGCDTYIFIGNTHVHRHKAIWNRPHRRIEPDWLYSRAVNGTPEFIAIWQGKGK